MLSFLADTTDDIPSSLLLLLPFLITYFLLRRKVELLPDILANHIVLERTAYVLTLLSLLYLLFELFNIKSVV